MLRVVLRSGVEHRDAVRRVDQIRVRAVVGHRSGIGGDDPRDAGHHRQDRAAFGLGFGQEGHRVLDVVGRHSGSRHGGAPEPCSAMAGLEPAGRPAKSGATSGGRLEDTEDLERRPACLRGKARGEGRHEPGEVARQQAASAGGRGARQGEGRGTARRRRRSLVCWLACWSARTSRCTLASRGHAADNVSVQTQRHDRRACGLERRSAQALGRRRAA